MVPCWTCLSIAKDAGTLHHACRLRIRSAIAVYPLDLKEGWGSHEGLK